MEAITQGTAEHIMHHVMINFILNGEMRFMQFDFTRESADTKNVFLFVEDYTVPQQQMMMLLEKGAVALTCGSSFYISNTKRRASKSPAFVV